MRGMKSPKVPKAAVAAPAPPPPPPVSATSTDVSNAGADEKQRRRKNYGIDKTITRSGGMNPTPPGTYSTIGR